METISCNKFISKSKSKKQQRDFSALSELAAHGVVPQLIVSGLFFRLVSAAHENEPPEIPFVIWAQVAWSQHREFSVFKIQKIDETHWANVVRKL